MDNDEAAKKIRKIAEKPENIRFAEQEGVEAFEALADEFLLEILGIKSAWISDKSSLRDFGDRADGAYEKIEAKYGVDVRGTSNLLDIFRAISTQNRTPH